MGIPTPAVVAGPDPEMALQNMQAMTVCCSLFIYIADPLSEN